MTAITISEGLAYSMLILTIKITYILLNLYLIEMQHCRVLTIIGLQCVQSLENVDQIFFFSKLIKNI